jgi:hypothetical protein
VDLGHQAMSDFFLSLIPDDPTYVPPVEARAQALAALRARLPPPAQVEAQVFDEVTFVDQGSNFEKVLCPACEEDITEHWAGLMQAASESEFSDLSLSMPCCGRLTNLNALSYIPPAGFARFSLRAMNPNIGGLLAAKDVSALEGILGCKLRQVYARY